MDPFTLAIYLVLPAVLLYTIVYALTRRRHRIAWAVTFAVVISIWSLAAIQTIPGSHAEVCSVLSTVGTGQSPCPTPHMPTVLLYIFGFLVIAGLAYALRPKAPVDGVAGEHDATDSAA